MFISTGVQWLNSVILEHSKRIVWSSGKKRRTLCKCHLILHNKHYNMYRLCYKVCTRCRVTSLWSRVGNRSRLVSSWWSWHWWSCHDVSHWGAGAAEGAGGTWPTAMGGAEPGAGAAPCCPVTTVTPDSVFSFCWAADLALNSAAFSCSKWNCCLSWIIAMIEMMALTLDKWSHLDQLLSLIL